MRLPRVSGLSMVSHAIRWDDMARLMGSPMRCHDKSPYVVRYSLVPSLVLCVWRSYSGGSAVFTGGIMCMVTPAATPPLGKFLFLFLFCFCCLVLFALDMHAPAVLSVFWTRTGTRQGWWQSEEGLLCSGVVMVAFFFPVRRACPPPTKAATLRCLRRALV